MQLQSMGIPSVATGEAVAPFLVEFPQAIQKQRELSYANTHNYVDSDTVQANRIAASAAGLQSLKEVMDWNGMGMGEQWSPARLGCDPEQVLGIRKSQSLPKREISIAEVCGL
jgi:hypothetical protein